MDSKTYWEKREAEALKHYITEEKEYQKRINRIYADMLDGINAEILRFYAKYAINEGITIAEAKKRVSRLDIEEYERKAERYVRERNFSKQANTEMRLYNATMKINRLEMLKANIGLELIKGHSELEEFMEEILQGRTEDELKRQAGILGDTVRDNAKAAHSIVNASFHNATFSQRIWMHNDIMKADLSKLLQSGLIRGKNPRVLAKEMRKYVLGDAKGGAEYNAERLMRTELGRVQIDAQLKSFKGLDFEEYMFHANTGCCDACLSLDGKHFKISEALSGENLPPMHPNCRCSVSAYADDEEYEDWIDFLSRGGTTEQYARNEWAKKNGRELTSSRGNGKMKARSGASFLSGARITNPVSDEANAWAKSYYAEIRAKSTDCKKIAERLNLELADIQAIKNYLFVDKSLYDDDLGIWREFDHDAAIAQSWQRLAEGKDILPHDLVLIKHELYEMEIKRENPGISHDKAHRLAEEKYNYHKGAMDYYGNLDKHRKKR